MHILWGISVIIWSQRAPVGRNCVVGRAILQMRQISCGKFYSRFMEALPDFPRFLDATQCTVY